MSHKRPSEELDKARADLASAMKRIPASGPVNVTDIYFVREALEACAKCFDAISDHIDKAKD